MHNELLCMIYDRTHPTNVRDFWRALKDAQVSHPELANITVGEIRQVYDAKKVVTRN